MAVKGNRFWEARAKSGRDKIFSDEDVLWKSAVEYFEWVMDNPLWENKVTQFQGAPVDMPVEKLRAMTINGLCLYLGIGVQTLDDYAKRPDFSGVVERIKSVIYEQKFTGAAADLLNSNIIARELGLKDLSKQELTGANGGPIGVQDMTGMSDEQLQAIIDAEG